MIIDIDPTDDPCHGKQENGLFHGYYWQTQYFPLLVFDGKTGDLIAPMLRPGTVHASEGADSLLKRVIKRIRKSFPDVKIKIRGDAGFGLPRMYNYCEGSKLSYIFGLAGNDVLKRHTNEIAAKQKLDFEKDKKDIREYITFKYQAKTWDKEKTVIAKIEYNEHGSNIRFIVTNIDFETPEKGYKYYTERGQCENYIKDLKNHLYLDRLSCCSYIANYFRMLLSCFGYIIMQELRLKLAGTEFEKMETNTIRLKLFKIGARIKESSRRIWINLSSYFIYKDFFLKLVT
ncbi:MAG TPA: IS1380 family transposase [Spirochaetota bacterium]|nr:IS1380 family transposase [Spirochaetota bacterium]